MQEADHLPARLRFGVFEIDLRAGELRKHGLRIRLQEQPFQILAMLLEHAGEVVTRDELQKKLWPADTFVDFDHGLNKAINKIRDALADSADSPRFVETVARRGYRFLAEVRVVDGAPVRSPEPAIEEVSQSPDAGRASLSGESAAHKRRVLPLAWTISAAVMVLLVVILTAWSFRFRNRTSPVIRSLAVLPLESLSGDSSQDYFADGMTDELITDLGQISALRVISRTSVMSYKRTRKPLPEIARELNVDAVVEGTVLRSGDQVRITAQLIQASDDTHLWAHSYEGDLRDTLALQNQVARAIAEQIRISLNPQEQAALKNVKVVNPRAYESFLKGRYFWNKRTADGLKVAVAYFKEAIEEDPNYAQAYSGLADTYVLLGDWEYAVLAPKEAFPKAKAAAIKALELDDTLSEAHTSLASMGMFDWDWETAGKEFRRAIELNPGYATAHQWYAWHLDLLGRNTEALSELRKAEGLDPLSLIIGADMADMLLVSRQVDEAIQQSRKAIVMDPNFAVAHFELGQALVEMRQYNEAITELHKAVELSGNSATFASSLAYAYAVSGRKNDALKILEDLERRSNGVSSNASQIALVYVGLGQKATAMKWLEKAYDERFNPSILLRPGFDPLRSDMRFQDLLHRMGLK